MRRETVCAPLYSFARVILLLLSLIVCLESQIKMSKFSNIEGGGYLRDNTTIYGKT